MNKLFVNVTPAAPHFFIRFSLSSFGLFSCTKHKGWHATVMARESEGIKSEV